MRITFVSLVACMTFGLSANAVDAMPLGSTVSNGSDLPIMKIAEGCGPGLVRGRRGTCLRHPAVFSRRGHIIRPGCGKPIGAGLRTPC